MPVTGIWQSVWLEGVGEYYPVDFRLTSCVERSSIKVEVNLNESPENASIRLTASFHGDLVAQQDVRVTTDRYVATETFLRHNEALEGIHMW